MKESEGSEGSSGDSNDEPQRRGCMNAESLVGTGQERLNQAIRAAGKQRILNSCWLARAVFPVVTINDHPFKAVFPLLSLPLTTILKLFSTKLYTTKWTRKTCKYQPEDIAIGHIP